MEQKKQLVFLFEIEMDEVVNGKIRKHCTFLEFPLIPKKFQEIQKGWVNMKLQNSYLVRHFPSDSSRNK